MSSSRTFEAAFVPVVVLTFVTGVVDAVGYLALDRVFTGNMTGNIVILGMGLAGSDNLPVLGPLLAVLAFVVGAFVAGLILRGREKTWDPRRTTALLLCGAAVLAGCGIALACGNPHDEIMQVVVAAATAAVMGTQAAVARRLAVTDMTTVVVTSTLTQLASESFLLGSRHSVVNRRLAAIVTIFLGAVAGALLLRIHVAVPMALAAVLMAGAAAIGHRNAPAPCREPAHSSV
ncbi:YoaK family protein [Williamsia muralis]|uniref:YoaK family protein n=1 Tax=Williamsia marianensis TaxID=85044 RepID=UPI003819EAA5